MVCPDEHYRLQLVTYENQNRKHAVKFQVIKMPNRNSIYLYSLDVSKRHNMILQMATKLDKTFFKLLMENEK